MEIEHKLQMPDGRIVVQGGPEDRAAWWTCAYCEFTGPHVGMGADGKRGCQGSCAVRPTTPNPNVPREPSYWKERIDEG
jgi:hypothetical protein